MRYVPRRKVFRVRRRLPSALLPLLVAFAVSISFFRFLSLRLDPLIETMAVSKATNLITLAVSEEIDLSLADEQLNYKDFVDMETGDGGQVTALSFKTAESTRFKRLVVERLINRLEQIQADELAVPLGNLTGVTLFSALGPSVRVRVQSVGDVIAEYENQFTSAGVNQTRHSIYLNVTVTIYLLIPGEIIPVSSTERVCIAETIVVGQVPDTYLNLQDGAN